MGFSRKNTEVACHSLLQGIFPIQGSNLHLLLRKQILYHLSHKGRPSDNNTKTIIVILAAVSWLPRGYTAHTLVASCPAPCLFRSTNLRSAPSSIDRHWKGKQLVPKNMGQLERVCAGIWTSVSLAMKPLMLYPDSDTLFSKDLIARRL